MKEIVTVLGTISKDGVGFCQCHEHIMLSKGKSFEINPVLCLDDPEKSLEEVKRYRLAGGGTVLDAQPGGCNRMAEELAYISRESGVNIIASTGFHKLVFYPEGHWIFTVSQEEMEDFLVKELTEGMYTDADRGLFIRQCGARAGFIKTALDVEGLSPIYRRLFSAAAGAAIRTNRFIMVHIEQAADPIYLLDFLMKKGVSPQNLMFCHMDRACKDLEVLKQVLKAGVYLEFDTIGRFKYHSDEYEIQLLQELIAAGYENQLLFSLDTTRARFKAYDASAVGLDYILTTFVPKLRRAGIKEETIRKISEENCVRFLTN